MKKAIELLRESFEIAIRQKRKALDNSKQQSA